MPFSPIFRVLFGLCLPGRTGHARSEISEADGSSAPFEAPVRAWRGVGFHNHRPALSGGRSRPFESIPADCFSKFRNYFIINELRIFQLRYSPHSFHRDETDVFGPSWA